MENRWSIMAGLWKFTLSGFNWKEIDLKYPGFQDINKD